MEELFEKFTQQYPISKTIRFELKPQGKTQEYIEKNGIIAADEKKAESYVKVKELIDAYHKDFISESLSTLQFDNLAEYERLYNVRKKSEKEEKLFEEVKSQLRKNVVSCFKTNPKFENLFKADLIKTDLFDYAKTEEEVCCLNEFKRFTTYFTAGVFDTRKNMYTDEAKSSSIAFRIVNQNLPKYIDNFKVLQVIKESSVYEEILQLVKTDKVYQSILNGLSLDLFFGINHYDKTVSNEEICNYNVLIGGYTDAESSKVKYKGINELVNKYNQDNAKNNNFHKLPKFKPLYKQILSDRKSQSFLAEEFMTDDAVIDSVAEVARMLHEGVLSLSGKDNLYWLLENLDDYDLEKIYLKANTTINTISQILYGDWSVIKSALEMEYDSKNLAEGKKVNERYLKKRAAELKRNKSYSIQYINEVVFMYTGHRNGVNRYFSDMNGNAKKLFVQFEEAYLAADELLAQKYQNDRGLKKDQKSIDLIKNLLDSIKSIERFCAPLLGEGTEPDKDASFYGEFTAMMETLQKSMSPLYDRVRNYVTSKPYSTKKIKLNFDTPTLLTGWDRNKESSNLAVLLEKEGLYYLGIMNKKSNKIFEEISPCEDADCYHKMNYKLLPGPNKMLPKVFFSKKNMDMFAPSPEMLRHYKEGTHKKGDKFNLDDCHELIDFFKQSIEKHEDWKKFEFKFSDTASYLDISEFYKEVEQQGYRIDFSNISRQYIDDLVESGKLYLFQIYNKDFSTYSKGRPNLHTIYWRMLFDKQNLENVVYKLNGEAEIFYRKASIKKENIISHPKNQPVKNKKDGAEKLASIFEYDLIKDKRFTVDKFQLHIPITMNFGVQAKKKMNDAVQQTICEQDNIHVIGIDRGERNLLYISVIDSNGKIVHQESMNQIEKQDYHKLLNTRENENKNARQNWQEINTIKELKEGYLSLVIHKIVELMLRYNAIVVLEDLNFGFMNGRKKVEKQVYQKFEKMLIDKLNYLVIKTRDCSQKGGPLQAYQLTGQFKSFKELGKQSGFLFYIPAWNTSKIDPTTGFVNLFSIKYTNVEAAQRFFSKFKSIKYNEDSDYFEFSFDYEDFTDKATGTKTEWTVCSYGERIVNVRNPQKNNMWDSKIIQLTKEMKRLLSDYEIDILSDTLKEDMISVMKKEFWVSWLNLFKWTLQLRNSETGSDIDYLLSPVKNVTGRFYDSRPEMEKYNKGEVVGLPVDADANGAYNIAKKGLWVIEQIKEAKGNKPKLAISNKEWLSYAQSHTIL